MGQRMAQNFFLSYSQDGHFNLAKIRTIRRGNRYHPGYVRTFIFIHQKAISGGLIVHLFWGAHDVA